MATFNNGESAASVRAKINAAIEKVDGTSPITSVNIDSGAIDGVTLGTNSAVTEAQVDNLNLNGNTISTTDTNGDLVLSPNGTGEVDISKVDIDGGTIDGTVIGGSTPAAISGTTGSFSGNLTVDTNTLFVNAASNNVGIGTSSPDRALTNAGNITSTRGDNPWYELVETDGTTTHNKVRLYLTADDFIIQSRSNADGFLSNDYRIFRGASGATAHQWSIAGSEAMRINSTGNVGIGTSNPQSELDVFGVGDIIRSTANDGSSNYMAFFDATGRKGYFGYGGATEDMTVANERNGFLRFLVNGSTRATITSSGDLGIGTTSPTERLHVSGNIIASGTSSTTRNILRTTSQQIEVRAGNTISFLDSDFPEATSVDAAVRFFRNTNTTGAKTVRFHRGDGTATEDARIGVGTANSFFNLGGGNVGIGEIAPDYKLDVNGAIGFTPGASVTPVDNGDVVFELTNNTTLTVKAKGSDGVVRSGIIILA